MKCFFEEIHELRGSGVGSGELGQRGRG